MDIEKLTHTGYRTSILIAVILSCMVVTFAALLGRGTLNLKGALLLDEPSHVTVIATVEPQLDEGMTISDIHFLRKQDSHGQKPHYDYQVTTSDGNQYLVRLAFNEETKMWTILHFEILHSNTTRQNSDV